MTHFVRVAVSETTPGYVAAEHVTHITQSSPGRSCIIHFASGDRLSVKEAADEIAQRLENEGGSMAVYGARATD